GGDKGIASGPSCVLHEFCHDTFTERSSEWAQGSRSVSMELSITMRPLYSMRKASPRVTLPISCATTLYCLAVWRTPTSDEALTDQGARAPRSLKRTASAEAGSSVKFRDAPRTGGASPAATEAKQDSARVTARPPSEISWADCSEPSAARPTRQSMRRFSAARSIAGGSPATGQASGRRSIASLNCHITSGFSGLPKLRQFVAAMGRAPLQATLRAASATACIEPMRGFNWHQRPLPSVERASARFTAPVLGSLTRTTAASLAPGPASVLVRTEVSYCSVIQRLEAIAGDASNFTKFEVRFVPSAAKANQSAAVSFLGAGAAMGR